MADEHSAGEVRLDLNLDTKGVEAQFDKLMGKIKNVFDRKAPADFNAEVEGAEQKASSLNSRLSSLAKKIKSTFSGKEQKKTGEETEKTEKKTRSLKDRVADLGKKIKETYSSWHKKQEESKKKTKENEDAMKRLKSAIIGAFSVTAVIAFGKACIDAANIQQEAERKLATVMINRMNASKESIQSVKDLASELQNLGVVGDEAAIAGAATLASYVSSAEAIKELLPAMENLAVYNFGSKINGDQMSDIAEQVGEAIATGAITTLESRKIVLSDKELAMWNNLRTEAERVEFISQKINSNLSNVNANALLDWNGKLQQTLNKLGDLKEKIGALLQTLLMPLLNLVSAVVDKLDAAAQRLMDVFGIKMSKSMGGAASASGVIEKGLEASNKQAEKLQRTLFGFDKINRLNAPTESETATATGSEGMSLGGSSASFTVEPKMETSRFLTAIEKISKPLKDLYDIMLKPIVDLIGEKLVNAIDWGLTKLEQLGAWVEANPEKFQALVVSILAVVAAIKGFLIVKSIITFFAALNPIIGGLIILVGLFVTAFIAGEGNIIEGFKKMLSAIWEGFWNFAVLLGKTVANLIGSIFGWIGKQAGKLINWISGNKEKSKEYGADYEQLSFSSGGTLPAFANGGFIRANTPTLFVGGDNKRQGEFMLTEQQFANAIDKYGSGVGNAQVVSLLAQLLSAVQGLQLVTKTDASGITNMVVSNINAKTRATGNCPIRT